MANQIRVTPDELRSLAYALHSCAKSVNSNVEEVRKVLYRLNDSWSGDAICEHTNQINGDLENMQNLQDQLRDLAAVVEQAASAIEASDSLIASFFRE